MRIIKQTERDRIRALPERWAGRWSHLPAWTDPAYYHGGTAKAVYDRLLRLNLETCTLEDLSNIGSFLPGWVSASCDACRMPCDEIVIYEGNPDFDEEDIEIALCKTCLSRGCAS